VAVHVHFHRYTSRIAQIIEQPNEIPDSATPAEVPSRQSQRLYGVSACVLRDPVR
jgi:hypothetical protein